MLTISITKHYPKRVREDFYGQSKYDQVGGVNLSEGQLTDEAEIYVETILDAKDNYESDLGEFVYVFSTAKSDDDDHLQGNWMNDETSVALM